MELQIIARDFSVCKLRDTSRIDFSRDYYFLSKTDEEVSLVCVSGDAPPDAAAIDDGWKAFRVQGVLEFSLIGILAEISALLAENKISIFAVSTYNTDYILTKAKDFVKALEVLAAAGYRITG